MGKTAQDRELIDRPRRMSKIDAGQGDASRDASPCSIELLWSAHGQRAAYRLPTLRLDQSCAARTAARWRRVRVLPSAAFRTAAGCTEQRRSLLAAAALVGFILVGLRWVSGRSAQRRKGDLKEQ